MAQRILGDLEADSKPYYCRLKSSSLYNKIVGRQSADKRKRWRLDFDPNNPEKGLHINIEDWSLGKGNKAVKIVIPIKYGNADSLIKHLNR